MRVSRQVILALAIAVLLTSGVAWASEPFLLEGGIATAVLQKCDILHHVRTCDEYHVVAVSTLGAGQPITLDNKAFVIKWAGAGYYTDSGVILHTTETAAPGLVGQQWTEAYPEQGRTFTSTAWKDLDNNQKLSTSDVLVLNSGTEIKIKDVRLNLWVEPVSVPVP